MIKTEIQEVVLSITCDVCGKVQDGKREVYWADRITECHWRVPPDGVNHGVFKGDLCRTCREQISFAIERMMNSLRKRSML